MSTAPAAALAVNKLAEMPKSMVPDPEWFDSD